MLLAHELDILLLELVPDVLVVHLGLLPAQLPPRLLDLGGRQLSVGGAGPTRTRNVIKTSVLELGCNNKAGMIFTTIFNEGPLPAYFCLLRLTLRLGALSGALSWGHLCPVTFLGDLDL